MNHTLIWIREIIKGKIIARILSNIKLLDYSLRGAVLDVGGGG